MDASDIKRSNFPKMQIIDRGGNTVAFSHSKQYEITPDDTNDLPIPCVAIRLSTEATVKLTLVDDIEGHTGVVWTAMEKGYHPLAVRKIYATGTDAGVEILGLI